MQSRFIEVVLPSSTDLLRVVIAYFHLLLYEHNLREREIEKEKDSIGYILIIR